MRDVRKLVIFSLCFLIGLLSQWHLAANDDDPVHEIVVSSVNKNKAVAKLPKCAPVPLNGRDIDEVSDLKRRYDSMLEKQQTLIKKYPGTSLITESERYANLEWKMAELRRIYTKKFSQESRARFCVRNLVRTIKWTNPPPEN